MFSHDTAEKTFFYFAVSLKTFFCPQQQVTTAAANNQHIRTANGVRQRSPSESEAAAAAILPVACGGHLWA